MYRNISIICRQLNSIPKIKYCCIRPCVARKYHDVIESFAWDVKHPLEVLELIPSDTSTLSSKDLSGIFNDLQRTQLQNPCDLSTIHNHPNFSILCESAKYTLASNRNLSSTNLISMLRIVQQLGLPTDHYLTQSILSAILQQVFALTLHDIFTLEKLLRGTDDKLPSNELHGKLLLVLPMVYQLIFMDRINYENVDELCATLHFMANNFERLSRRAIPGVVTSLRMSGAHIKPKQAIQIIAALSNLKYVNAHIEPLLKKCVHLAADAHLSPKEIFLLLNFLNKSKLSVDCCDEQFFEKCVQTLILDDCDVVLACAIGKILAELKFSSVELLEFICMKLDNNSLPLYETVGLIFGLRKAAHKPSNWDEVVLPMIEKMQLCNFVEQNSKVNWPCIAESLIQFGHYDSLLIERIMRSDLREKFQQNYGESFRELRKLCGKEGFSVLKETLTDLIGESKVLSNVSTKYEAYINYVLKINKKTGQFTSFADHHRENEKIALDEIHREADELLIGIISSNLPSFKVKPLLTLDLAIVPIGIRKFNNMPEYVRISETFNKITKRIQLYQHKVEAGQRRGSRPVDVNDE